MNHCVVGPKPLKEALERYWIERKADIATRREQLVLSTIGTRKGFFQLGAKITREEAEEMVNPAEFWWTGGYWDKKAKELKALADIAAYGEGVVIDDETANWLKDYWNN